MKREKIDNTQLLKDTGLKIRHFHTVDRYGYSRPRNLTVAFKEGRSTLEIATAVVHPSDCFSRKVGTKLACEAFCDGHRIVVPKALDFGENRPASANETLRLIFG
jgi:hypothetical protein